MSARPLLLGTSLLLSTMLLPFVAHATDVQACLGASEKGQRARSAGRLREARDQFQVCGAEGCPALVRRDCTQWQAEVMSTLPTVVFGARDKQGRDLFEVTVTMDGETLSKRLDGKAVAVDPGPHSFKFETPGAAPVLERALVKEGEKTRVITVSFTDAGSGDPVTPTPPADRSKNPPAAGADREHSILPWIVIGVGAATMITGVVLIATSPSTPDGCNTSSQTCTRRPTDTDEAFANRQKEAGTADTQPKQGIIVSGVGVGLVAIGLIWHFLEPTGPEKAASIQFTPWAAPGRRDAGGAIVGTF